MDARLLTVQSPKIRGRSLKATNIYFQTKNPSQVLTKNTLSISQKIQTTSEIDEQAILESILLAKQVLKLVFYVTIRFY